MALLRRYLSGLAVATLGLCAAGWLAFVPTAFGYRGSGPDQAALADRATGAGLAVVSLVTLVCSVLTWRRRLRADGVLAPKKTRAKRRRSADTSPEPAPDPAQVLNDLRVLLASVLAGPGHGHGPVLNGLDPSAVSIPAPRTEPQPAEPAQPDWPAEPEDCAEPAGHAEPGDITEPGAHAEPAGPDGHPGDQAEPDYYDGVPGPGPGTYHRDPEPRQPEPQPGGLAAMESMLAGAELLMVGCGEEETW
jgi:hypothetical protein